MKRRYKTPLLLKLFIATTSWGLVFGLLSLISNDSYYQVAIWVWAIVILTYNITILIITHKRETKPKDIKFKPQCSGYGVFPGGKKCKGCQDCKGPNFINKNNYEFKTDEPWAI